jgi:hypothetical protein
MGNGEKRGSTRVMETRLTSRTTASLHPDWSLGRSEVTQALLDVIGVAATPTSDTADAAQPPEPPEAETPDGAPALAGP